MTAVFRTLVVLAACSAGSAAPALAAQQPAPPQGPQPLTPTFTPLDGSTFQGADGNQVFPDQEDPPPTGQRTDWAALQSAGRVVHAPDDNVNDTTFAGGAKEGEPAAWTFTTTAGGVTPAKANILDAWSAVDQPGNGKTFLYLAFARNAPTGDTFLTFELNQDSRLWTNDAGVKVPCRRTGDILISYEISGNRADVVVWRWQTGSGADNTDPATGCARSGTIEPATAVRPNVDGQGALNGAPPPPFDNALGFVNALGGFFGATIPGLQFGEAALDLNALLGPEFAGGCYAFGSIWMHSRASNSYTSQMQDIVSPRPIDVRTCAAAGTKFFDLNADGQRESGEPGIPGFEIFADYNANGKLDAGEPFTFSDHDGRYVLNDIRPPRGGTYSLRERVPLTSSQATNDWQCSFPNGATPGGFRRRTAGLTCGWGPIDPDQEPYARGRDFGNWYPAQLTIRKQLFPDTDPGRFDLFVNTDPEPVLRGAKDGSEVTLAVPPGRYTVSEVAVPPTDATQYTSSSACKLFSRKAARSSGTVSASVELAAGGRATCTFYNARTGVPAIAIDKHGPSIATAGDTLHYTLDVTNPGTVALPAGQVDVADSGCDDDPVLEGKADASGASDGTPGTLDPGDVWTYTCSRKTSDPGADCELSVVHNTGTATGPGGISDTSTISTTLDCPDTPPPDPPDPIDPPVPPNPVDPPVPPQPSEPIPISPVVPGQGILAVAVAPPIRGPLPVAGQVAVAGITASRVPRCVSRVSRTTVRGTRIAVASVFVDGRLVRRLHPAAIQRRVTIPGFRAGPGRHRITVRVSFELGSGTRPLTLTRIVTICRSAGPRFTG